jgi:hypothetical protein
MSDVQVFETMPTAADLDHNNPELYAAAVLLIENGINPFNIPPWPGAINAAGYLQVTGRALSHPPYIETRLVPWGEHDGMLMDAVERIVAHATVGYRYC